MLVLREGDIARADPVLQEKQEREHREGYGDEQGGIVLGVALGSRRTGGRESDFRARALQQQRDERKPDMGRLVAVASAVAQNPSLQGTATIAAQPAAAATMAAHPPAAAATEHAPAGASATSSDSAAGAERDLTYDEVNSKVHQDREPPPDGRSALRSSVFSA